MKRVRTEIQTLPKTYYRQNQLTRFRDKAIMPKC